MIRGWVNDHKHVVSKKVFSYVDHQIWSSLWRWCCRRHPKKGKHWIKDRYFHSIDGQNWVFAAKDHLTGQLKKLIKASHTKIRRHPKIKGDANPYDPSYEQYFEQRDTKKWQHNCKSEKLLILWSKQKGICPVCSQRIIWESEREIHHIIRRVDGGSDATYNLSLLHPNCHKQIHHNTELGNQVNLIGKP